MQFLLEVDWTIRFLATARNYVRLWGTPPYDLVDLDILCCHSFAFSDWLGTISAPAHEVSQGLVFSMKLVNFSVFFFFVSVVKRT